MKKSILWALLLSLPILFGCNPQNDDPDGPDVPVDPVENLEGPITMYVDRTIIKADGSYPAVLKVLLMDKKGVEHDVTADVEIYCEGSDALVEDPVFKTTTEGEYTFYAVHGFEISNTVVVNAVKGVGDIPADSKPDNVEFRHRMLLLQHTGNECPNCPRLMEILKKLSDDEAYAPHYLHVASHSYNTSDPAYTSAAASLSKELNLTGYYPWLTYNLTTKEGYYIEDIKDSINSYKKDVADAGISAAVTHSGNHVYANVSIKSAIESKYRVAVWLLEDNIHAVQSGATASWQNMHENCLRAMSGVSRAECIYGQPLGLIEEGGSKDFIASIELDPSWKIESCKVIIIAVAAGEEYELLNCAVCPVGETISYEYK